MTYERLFNLKFIDSIPTYELGRMFPKEIRKISHVALLELPTSTLRTIIKRNGELERILKLKKEYLQKAKKKRS